MFGALVVFEAARGRAVAGILLKHSFLQLMPNDNVFAVWKSPLRELLVATVVIINNNRHPVFLAMKNIKYVIDALQKLRVNNQRIRTDLMRLLSGGLLCRHVAWSTATQARRSIARCT